MRAGVEAGEGEDCLGDPLATVGGQESNYKRESFSYSIRLLIFYFVFSARSSLQSLTSYHKSFSFFLDKSNSRHCPGARGNIKFK